MKPLVRGLVLVFAWLPFAIGVLAQQAPQAHETLKRIFVTVVDQAGTPVLDLSPSAFEVIEGGLRRDVVRASLVKEPMCIALIVDTSQQSATSLTHIRRGLHAFLDAIPEQDEVLIMSTGGQARVRLTPTVDRMKLSTAVDGLFAEGGSAVLLDGLRESWARFLRDAENRWPVFVVVGTSGPDSSSTRNPEFQIFIRELQGAAANAHVIMLNSSQPLNSRNGFNAITASLNVTSYTGGHYEALAASSALPARMKELAERIAVQQQQMSTTYEVDFTGQTDDPRAQIGVYVAHEGAGIGLSLTRPIE